MRGADGGPWRSFILVISTTVNFPASFPAHQRSLAQSFVISAIGIKNSHTSNQYIRDPLMLLLRVYMHEARHHGSFKAENFGSFSPDMAYIFLPLSTCWDISPTHQQMRE